MGGTCLVVQRSRLCASTPGGAGWILGRGTKIPLAIQPNKNDTPVEMGNWGVEKWNNLPRSKKKLSGDYLRPWSFTPETSLKKKILSALLSWCPVAQSCPTLRPHGLQCARLPCPSLSPRVYSHLGPLSWWCHPTINHLIPCRPFLHALNLSQNQGLFKWVSSSHQVAKVLEFQLQHQSSQWIFRTDFLEDLLVWSPCSPRDSQESSPAPQFKSTNSSAPSLLYGSTLCRKSLQPLVDRVLFQVVFPSIWIPNFQETESAIFLHTRNKKHIQF